MTIHQKKFSLLGDDVEAWKAWMKKSGAITEIDGFRALLKVGLGDSRPKAVETVAHNEKDHTPQRPTNAVPMKTINIFRAPVMILNAGEGAINAPSIARLGSHSLQGLLEYTKKAKDKEAQPNA